MRAKSVVFAALVVLASTLYVAESASAATKFRSCTHMHQRYANGVAKSKAAANKQVRAGMPRPKVSPKQYRANRRFDVDKDGTSCERVPVYPNCRRLQGRFPNGVAVSRSAAAQQVINGYGYPFVSATIYRANRSLDTNRDGTVCEGYPIRITPNALA